MQQLLRVTYDVVKNILVWVTLWHFVMTIIMYCFNMSTTEEEEKYLPA